MIQNSSNFQYPQIAGRRWMSVTKQNNSTGIIALNGATQTLSFGSGATQTNSQDTDGEWLSLNTGVTNGSAATLSRNTINNVRLNWLFDWTTVVKTDLTLLSSQQIWVGLFDINITGSNNLDSQTGIGFRYDKGGPTNDDTNWQAICGNSGGAGTSTVVDTGIAVAADTKYVFRILVETTGQVRCYINGILVATLTTRLPGGATDISPMVTIKTFNTTAKSLKFSQWFMSLN